MTKEITKLFANIAIIFSVASAISAFVTKESQPWWLDAIDSLIIAYLFYVTYTDRER